MPRCSPATHGQPATPSTMGKELAVFAWRLERVRGQIAASDYLAKFSGATGTWSAHLAADPDADWPTIAREYIEGLGLGFNILTTQIESHDWQVELYDRVRHAGGILHNLATDIWTYIVARVLRADPGRRRNRLVDDAAQDQPDPLRERRGEHSRSRVRCSPRSARPWSPAACSATSPTPPRSATSASRSGTRCSPSTTCAVASMRSRSRGTCCWPTST